MADAIKTNLGPVTAYADAKAHGYTGTREEFGQLLANAGLNLKAAETAKEGAEAAKQAAETAQKAAAENQKNAGTRAANAKASADTAAEQADAAKESAAGAANSASAAQESETNAGLSATAAANAEAAAKQAQQAAETAKTDAEAAKTAAGTSADAAANSAADAKKTLESIPADYSALSGKVDENTSGISELKEEKLNKPALPVVGELLRVKSVSDAGEVGLETEDISELQKRQNILVGSEIGNPVSCDDVFEAPLCGLTVYGKSTQDGTPTPDSPVPIVSAGDGGSVVVKVTGANMLEGTKPGVKSTVHGITYTTYENGVLITGTATADFSIDLHEDMIHRLTRGIYYLTTRGLSPSTGLDFYFIGNFYSDTQNLQVTLTRDVNYSLQLKFLKGATLNTTVQVSLTRNKITTYSPYREQLLTLPTPNGLPGIPVASGGNYTDSTGQQWVCDEVDLERGMKVLRIDKGAFDATKALAEQSVIRDTPIETPLTPAEIAAYKALTAYAPDTVVQASDGAGVKLEYQRDVNIAIKKLEDAIASMTAT